MSKTTYAVPVEEEGSIFSIRNIVAALVTVTILAGIGIAVHTESIRTEYATIAGAAVLVLWALVIACDVRCVPEKRRHYNEITNNDVKRPRCEPQWQGQETA
ncbi:hypothetical protein MRX96_055586 [Rhipicephalus microplus]